MVVLLPVVICVSTMSDIVTVFYKFENTSLGINPGPGIHSMYGITVEGRVPHI